MRRLFRPEVPADIDEAARWYEERGSGLGRAFVVLAIMDLSRDPGRWRGRR
jgi:hypothetical protein